MPAKALSNARRKHERRRFRQRTVQLFNLVGAGILLAAIGLLGTLLVRKVVVEPQQPTAQVTLRDGSVQAITSAAFQERARFERTRLEAAENDLDFGARVLDRMVREILVRDEAARRRLTAGEDDIDRLIAETYGAGPTVTPAATGTRPAKYREALKTWARFGLSEAGFREILRTEVLEQKLTEAFFQDVPAQQDQARLRLIRFESESGARQALGPGWGTEAFAVLYDQVTAGTVASATATILDWTSVGDLDRDFNPALRQAAFGLLEGRVFSEPIAAAGGWYLGQMLEREARALPEDWRRQRAESDFEQWLAAQQARVTRFPRWMERVPAGKSVP